LPVACRIVVCDFILIRCDANYKRGARAKRRFISNRKRSVAAMQERARNSQQIAAEVDVCSHPETSDQIKSNQKRFDRIAKIRSRLR
jgi:hypothetical protein